MCKERKFCDFMSLVRSPQVHVFALLEEAGEHADQTQLGGNAAPLCTSRRKRKGSSETLQVNNDDLNRNLLTNKRLKTELS